ncbi:hypothetical protein FHL15_010359 [Xylaria flabelliformis]|uniref:Uncharacterized protein n=1 Tax=Xylaria flabelliformis TaxID=2512241 RepID=A0A553HLF4_9PEZI|nr:hypothetical protein FHL15_010359 [Xylaria flabelliformis]
MAAEDQDTARGLSTDESADEGGLPAIASIDGTNDNEDEQPFPNSKFPFFKKGTGIDPTTTQNSSWIFHTMEDSAYKTPDNSFCTKSPIVAKHRILYKRNNLGMDERHLRDIDDPEEYWKAVLKIAPPRPWMDVSEVMKHLTRVHPMEKPSMSNLWRDAKALLSAAAREGSRNGWNNDANIRVSKTDPEFWEALRIVGDAEDGHGVFPSKLRSKIVSAGFAWIFAEPVERILPQCWEKYASRMGLPFYKSMPVMHRESDNREAATLSLTGHIITPQSFAGSPDHSGTLTPQRSRNKFRRGGIPVRPDEQQQYLQDLYKRAEQGGSAYLEGSQMQLPSKDKAPTLPRDQDAMQDIPRPTVEDEPFVEPNVEAAHALRSMRTKDAGDIQRPPRTTISRPIDYANAHHLWAATEQNIAQLSTNLTKLHNLMPDEMEKVVFTAMKHAIDDGPIEGKIREVLGMTLQKAGLQSKEVMQSTIEELVAISTERDRKVIGSVQATIAGLAENQQSLQETTRIMTQRLEALESKIEALEHATVAQGNSAAKIKAEPTHEPDHHQDASQQANPTAEAQPTDLEHTTQVIPRKRKNIWAQ